MLMLCAACAVMIAIGVLNSGAIVWVISVFLVPGAAVFFLLAWRRMEPASPKRRVGAAWVYASGVVGLLFGVVAIGLAAQAMNAIANWKLDPKLIPAPPRVMLTLFAGEIPAALIVTGLAWARKLARLSTAVAVGAGMMLLAVGPAVYRLARMLDLPRSL